ATDIPRHAKTGKPRGFLRLHGQVGRFYKHHDVKPGTLLRLERLSPRAYRLSVQPPPDTSTKAKISPVQSDFLNGEPATNRSGSFVGNMRLPAHRWFRYSAGFSAQWVADFLRQSGKGQCLHVLDPFAGSGTVVLEAQFA